MVETMGKVKQFQDDLSVYRTCLDDELAKVSPELESYEEIQRMNAQKYNASVEDEQKMAEEWGEAVRAFKSK